MLPLLLVALCAVLAASGVKVGLPHTLCIAIKPPRLTRSPSRTTRSGSTGRSSAC
jgi:hypothetical protein